MTPQQQHTARVVAYVAIGGVVLWWLLRRSGGGTAAVQGQPWAHAPGPAVIVNEAPIGAGPVNVMFQTEAPSGLVVPQQYIPLFGFIRRA